MEMLKTLGRGSVACRTIIDSTDPSAEPQNKASSSRWRVLRMKIFMSADKRKIQKGGCGYLCCCNYRLSVSSSEDDDESSGRSQHHGTISLLAHAMVQERLDQIIRERQREGRSNRRMVSGAKFVVMVAVEVESNDLMKDFRVSMTEMISSNAIEHPKELRRLLNLYLAVNSELVAGAILQVFYEVCTYMFLG